MADINNVNLGPIDPLKASEITSSRASDNPQGISFKDILQSSINEIKDMNEKADVAIEKLATGEVQDMHQVMLAIEKADLTFKTMMQIRNKLLDAYQEVMRMRF